ARTCIEAERNREVSLDLDLSGQKFNFINQAVAMSTLFSAYHLQAKAIIALTTSGATALWLSRINIGIPVYALTDSNKAAQQMALYNNVHPILVDNKAKNTTDLRGEAKKTLVNSKLIEKGDTILLTCGDNLHEIGGTNTMKIETWEDLHDLEMSSCHYKACDPVITRAHTHCDSPRHCERRVEIYFYKSGKRY